MFGSATLTTNTSRTAREKPIETINRTSDAEASRRRVRGWLKEDIARHRSTLTKAGASQVLVARHRRPRLSALRGSRGGAAGVDQTPLLCRPRTGPPQLARD